MTAPRIKYLNQGFTLIELLVVLGLVALLAVFASINLIRPQTKISVDSTVQTLISDIRQQQIKTMSGDTEGQGTALNFGVYFSPTSYTLFRGSTYNPSDISNFEVELDTNLNLSTTFGSSEVVFSRRAGEINNFVGGANTITVTNSADGESKVFFLNQLGAVSLP